MKILVGISGASGARLGWRLASEAAKAGAKVGVIVTNGAREVLASEDGFKFELNISNLNDYFKFELGEDIEIWRASEIWAPPASGSALFDALIVSPCSANTLAKIACALSDNLLTRAAAVMLKERRRLILAVRETPLSPISLRQMADLAALGVVIAPPAMGYYHAPRTLADMEDFIVGKWLDALGVKHNLFARWGEKSAKN